MNRHNAALLAAFTLVTASFVPSLGAAVEAPARRNFALTAPTLFPVLDSDRDGILSPAEQANAAIALRALDTDDDGVISATELAGPVRTGLSRRGLSMTASALTYRPTSELTLLVQLDANHDGVIQPLELANAASSLRNLDSNQDGVVTRNEV